MAVAPPPVIDVQAGAKAIEEDLPRVLAALGVTSLEELGWVRPDKLTLLIPMRGERGGNSDNYLLRLGFKAYRRFPPSAQFVNPQTSAYDPAHDQKYVPRLASQECHTHTAYPKPGGGTVQLICCSAVLEFYEVAHDVKSEHLWRDTNTFLTTVTAIRRAFTSSYAGRF